ncbi:ATP-binding protein [Sphingobacterium spiritivorum]|uniref:histidine kinase n=1 Tax=Sphingobacterium spiritivorum ATCC 33861 TaxID=525373 RepID=D7VKL4_SPHSI|nr:ATP-binding protein [Sphingobacterium spiritivorum]EFK58816.1 PAS domain S-box protein [Sphingobacterium spiritivorum ATCC 33861]QQT34305.1 HAMP domain-containing protein [Sphingobacterium spiritivorum]WQD35146.1 ATP-binding protein [Sphingobacterium spiritivorum]SUI99473.1 Alginate biosynthesis sensor protein kinB [Sphingobacterium spiritivorum]
MRTKEKLTFGVGVLFLLIVLLAGVSTYYVNSLKKDTKNILLANYNTLEYGRNMLLALDKLDSDPQALTDFEKNLRLQRANETEKGEKEATEQIVVHLDELKKNPQTANLKDLIREDIAEVMRLNMEAIGRKSDIANETAASAIIWISVTGALCFLIAFVLFVNLPGNIADPIRELTGSIRQIAAQNYSERVHFEGHSEFGELARSFNTMAQKLEEYSNSKLATILKEKTRIETLINNMHDPVIGIDEQKKILFANHEALKVTGLEWTAIQGRQIQDIAVSNDLVRLLIRDMMNPGQGSAEPVKIAADGKQQYFEKEIIDINVVPTGEQNSELIGYVIMLKNITPFKELDFAKTNFIATVSHELKTPISSIKMSLNILAHERTGTLTNEQQQLLESIGDDSERLLKITSELLNMSQVETGNIQLNMQANDPVEILKYAVDTTRIPAEQKGLSIIQQVQPDLPFIQVDAEKTAWVLTNFITNAIRYSSDHNEIIVSLYKEQDRLVFAVQDFGRGIDSRYQERIFERYFQIPGSAKSGTGLGLAISKDFIENQSGKIGVESKPGLGSTFYFSFPVES